MKKSILCFPVIFRHGAEKRGVMMMKKKRLLMICVAGSLAASCGAGNVWAAEEGDALSSDLYDIGPVIVTANRVEEPILEAKADISVVSRKEIEEMHMQTVEEALRTVPGVQFLNYGQNGMNANLSGIRINGSNDVVILVDGVRVTDFQGAGSSGYMYASLMNNMSNIERVEVLRGAAGTLYGSGAKGGVINIITKKIDNTSSMLDVSRSSFDGEGYKFSTQGRKGKLAYTMYIDKDITGSYKDGDGVRWPGHTNTESGGVKVSYDFTEDNTLTVNYDRMNSDYFGVDRIYEGPYNGYYDSKMLSIRDDWKIDDRWSNRFSYRQNRIETSYAKPFGEGGHSGSDEKPNVPYDASSDMEYNLISDQVTFQTDRHTLTFGLDYSKAETKDGSHSLGYDSGGNPIRGDRSMKNYSWYAQEEWKISPVVTLTGGIRHDRPEGDEYAPDMESHTSKSYKIAWDATDKDTFYAGRSDFFILPDVTQLYDGKYGNAALKPAYGRTSSIGYNREFSPGHYLTVNWFETKSDRTIGYDASGKYENYEGGINRGWNAQYARQIGENWLIKVGWAHLFASSHGDNFALGYYPKDLATFGVYYNKEKLGVALDGFYFMRRTNPANSAEKGWPADNYGVYNLSVNYSPNKSTTFYMKVDNIFDKLWAEHTDVIWGGGPGSWYSQPGRALTMGMQLKF